MKQIAFNHISQEFIRVYLTLPYKAGVEAVVFVMDRFRAQAWLDHQMELWPDRKKPDKGARRALLVKTGALKRSIRIIRAGSDYVVIGSNLSYARVHNKGFKGTVRVSAHTKNQYSKEKYQLFTRSGAVRNATKKVKSGQIDVKAYTMNQNIPPRRFLGASEVLTFRIKQMIEKELLNAFN